MNIALRNKSVFQKWKLFLLKNNFKKMEKYFKQPTARYLAKYIYQQVIFEHETGGRCYYYKIPPGMTFSCINDTIELLGELLLDVDVLQYEHGCIVIDWS
jgi:hypothetical protein